MGDARIGFLGFAVAVAYGPGLLSPAYTPRWIVISIGLPLVSRLDPRVLSAPIGWVLLWTIGLGAVSLIASPDRMAGALELFFIVLLCGTFLAGAALDDLDAAMTGLGAGLTVSSVVCIIQALGWAPLLQTSPRPSGLFQNSEVIAEFAAIIFVWAAVRPRWLIAAAAAVPLAVCGSRIAVLVSMIGLVYAWWPRSWAPRLALAAALPVIAALMLTMLGIDKFGSAGHRVVLWIASAMAITPLGEGLGWFQVAHRGETFAHSDIIQAFVEFGYGAVALAIVPIVAFARNRGNRAERAAFVAVCVEIAVSFPLHMPATGFLAALVAGYLACSRPRICLGQPDSRAADDGAVRWSRETGLPDSGPSRWRGRAVSVRSQHSGGAAIC